MKLSNLCPTITVFLLALVCLNCTAVTALAQSSKKAAWKNGDVVEVEWKGKWYKAAIIESKGDSFRVHYDGYDEKFDETVEAKRIRSSENPDESKNTEKKAKPAKEWIWKDGAGNTRTLAEFQTVLRQHSLWLLSDGQQGAQANLTNADLQEVDLKAVNLSKAEMPGVNLTKADMSATFMNEANLSGAQFYETNVFGLMSYVNLSGATFNQAKVSGTLGEANLSNVRIFNSDFTDAILARANLHGAVIFDSNFTNAHLGYSNLTKAVVMNGDWTDVNLFGADVRALSFEPVKNPDTRNVAGAANLEFITYGVSPDSLMMVRNSLREGGFDDAQRKVTYALKRRQNELRLEQAKDKWFKYVYHYLNLVFFDWTVRYGLQPERALIIMFYLWLVFAVIYDLFIHFPGRSGIFLVKNRVRKNASLTSAMRVRPRAISRVKGWKRFWLWIKSEWRVLRISLFYSATRALHLGYGDLDLGRWLQMLTKREYELRPKHWTRSISGLQSLISLFLIVMWLLTEYSNPFD